MSNPEISSKSENRSANIFVNYRREDSAGHAGRMFDRLRKRFAGRVFMDVDTIEPGVDFVEVLKKAVGSCEVLIVVIGREWLNLTDASGLRRLDDPGDFVRLEVATALARSIRVIPVLVEGASMPRAEDLPPDLAKLARRNAIELSDGRWEFDVDRLIQAIEVVLQDKAPSAFLPAAPAPRKEPRAWIALAALAALLLAGGVGWTLVKPEAPQQSEVIASAESVPESTVNLPAPPTSPVIPEEPLEKTPAPQSGQEPEAYGRDTCKKGFVWRGPEDHVCVTPDVREQTLADNLQAAARRDPAGGLYGSDTCLPGYVWREAFVADHACVLPDTRVQAQVDNGQADERRMRSVVRFTKSLFKGRDR